MNPPSRKLAAQDLPVYVINLDRRTDRWRFQKAQARLHRLSIERVSALDGAAGRRRFPDAALNDGEIGVWATFDSLVSRMVSEGIQAAVVLEDDAALSWGFLQKVIEILKTSSDEVALIQLGFLTDSTWRPYLTPAQNLRKILRPRSRLRALRESPTNRMRTTTGIRGGAHALLVFPERLAHYLPALRPDTSGGEPLDMAFISASQKYPHAFIRVRRSMAGQLPVRSDIQRR